MPKMASGGPSAVNAKARTFEAKVLGAKAKAKVIKIWLWPQ